MKEERTGREFGGGKKELSVEEGVVMASR